MSTGAAADPPRCLAPFTSMYLDPRGAVRACCQNVWHPLGHVTENSLHDIWRGPAADELRRRLAAGDLSLGCELCAADVALGNEASAHLHQFDDLARDDAASARWPRQLELALTNACNLQCIMCNGELSSAIRVHREGRAPLPQVYGDAFFDELDDFLPHLDRVVFLGGEPFLGAEPLRVMDRVADLGLQPVCHVNSNGTQWTPRVRRIVEALPVHLAISVDGWSGATIESVRRGADRDTLVRHVGEMRAACDQPQKGFSLTFCLMTANWHELAEVMSWGERLDCDVFVNTVTNPPGLSLHQLPPPAISEVREQLGRRDREIRHTLTRNLDAWDRAVAYVDSLARRSPALVSVSVGVGPRSLERAVRDWVGDADVVRMDVDESLLIVGIEPDRAMGVALDHLVGTPSVSFVEEVGPSLGRLTGTELDLRTGGIELRRFHFERGMSRRTLVAAMVKRSGGETWYLSVSEPMPVGP